MRVLAVSVILFAGGAWAQHFLFVNSEKDLLALPSDQLIHSDAELLAVESVPSHQHSQQSTYSQQEQGSQSASHYQQQSNFDHLPFGARLPGFEKVTYAYGYTIPDQSSGSTKTKNSAQQTHFSHSSHYQTSGPTNTGSDSGQHTHFSHISEQSESKETGCDSAEHTHTSQHQTSGASHFSTAPNPAQVELKPLEIYLRPPDRDFILEDLKVETHALETKPSALPQISYLPPPPTTTTTPQPSLPQGGYLPPRTDPPTTTTTTTTTHPPPTTPATDYLPPRTKQPSPQTSSVYFPPLPPPTSPPPPSTTTPPPPSPTPPTSEYLPPPLPVSPPPVKTVYPPPDTSKQLSPVVLIPLSEIYDYNPPTGIQKPQSQLTEFGKEEFNPIIAGAKESSRPQLPLSVTGEQKTRPLKVIHGGSQKPVVGPISVIEHEEPGHLIFYPGESYKPVVGAIGHEIHGHIKAQPGESYKPVFSVIGHEEPGHIKFHAGEGYNPVVGAIGHEKLGHIKAHPKENYEPVVGVIGHEKHGHIKAHAGEGYKPVVGAIGHEKHGRIKAHPKENYEPVVGAIGHEKHGHIKAHAGEGYKPVVGAIGHEKLGHIKAHPKENYEPVVGAIGNEKHGHIKAHPGESYKPVVGAIGHEKHGHIKAHPKENYEPVVGAIGHEKHGHIKVHAGDGYEPVVGAIGHEKHGHIKFQKGETVNPAIGVVGEHKDRPFKVVKAPVRHPPYGLVSLVQKEPDCKRNTDCSQTEICLRGTCVKGCDIAAGICVGHAVCRTQYHIPACLCLNMSTAVTRRRGGQERYDCMPMAMMGGGRGTRGTNRRRIRDRTLFLRPQAIAVLRGSRHPQERVVSGGGGISTFSRPSFEVGIPGPISSRPISGSVSRPGGSFGGNPCSPSPCGPNTDCRVNRKGIAQCRCIPDYVPDGNTINGCKPQCIRDDDCPDDFRCSAQKCVRVCTVGACGLRADCFARNHQARCSCPSGFRGNAEISCHQEEPEFEPRQPAPPLDPCVPNPCGTNAECKTRGDRPVCTCPLGYEGDPLLNCRRGECIENRDCPGHRVCQRLRCVDPCSQGICGQGAECTVRDYQPICSCPRGFVGDPFTRCRRFDPQELCNPTPCGSNTNCKVKNDRAVCSCFKNYIGNPLTGCRPECVTDSECPHNMACRDNICVNPCVDACGEGAYCDVRQGRAICRCPEFYQGDPHSRCYAECTAHDDCPSYQACFQLQCTNPCDGACGTGADCKVEDHKPICSCPRGYTGHPFERCRKFTREDLCNPNPCGSNADCTPGFDRNKNDRPVCTCPTGFIGNPLVACQRGECETNNECQDHEACYQYTCKSPCFHGSNSVCGENADCNVKRHQPVCSCPRGYTGDPLSHCRIGRPSSLVQGHSK